MSIDFRRDDYVKKTFKSIRSAAIKELKANAQKKFNYYIKPIQWLQALQPLKVYRANNVFDIISANVQTPSTPVELAT